MCLYSFLWCVQASLFVWCWTPLSVSSSFSARSNSKSPFFFFTISSIKIKIFGNSWNYSYLLRTVQFLCLLIFTDGFNYGKAASTAAGGGRWKKAAVWNCEIIPACHWRYASCAFPNFKVECNFLCISCLVLFLSI